EAAARQLGQGVIAVRGRRDREALLLEDLDVGPQEVDLVIGPQDAAGLLFVHERVFARGGETGRSRAPGDLPRTRAGARSGAGDHTPGRGKRKTAGRSLGVNPGYRVAVRPSRDPPRRSGREGSSSGNRQGKTITRSVRTSEASWRRAR